MTGIKSDLPGDVIATVTEPVYDTATGKFLLIPQGSRILGKIQQPGELRAEPRAGGVEPDHPAGHVFAEARQPRGHRSGRLFRPGGWRRLALGSRLCGAALTTLLGVGAELAAPENRQDGNRIVIAGRDSARTASIRWARR